MTPAQAMAAKVKDKAIKEPDPNAVPVNEVTIPIINEEEIPMPETNTVPVNEAPQANPEQVITIPVTGVSALINALNDTQKNLMEFKFHDVTAGEITNYLSNINNIQQCVQYLGEVVKTNYENMHQ